MTRTSFRVLQQPGPASEPRRVLQVAEGGKDFLVDLPPGADLMNGLVQAVIEAGEDQAGFILLRGALERAVYTTGRADDSGERVATPHGPFEREGPFTVIGGSAILGRGPKDEAFLHCHALLADKQGTVIGGHLRPGLCPLGPGGLRALAACPTGAGFKVAADAETNFSIFRMLHQEVPS